MVLCLPWFSGSRPKKKIVISRIQNAKEIQNAIRLIFFSIKIIFPEHGRNKRPKYSVEK
jgi:hypothetical protein